MAKYQCLRGMRDLSPKESERFEYIETILKSIVTQYGYQPIRFPILESAELFNKSIGIETDIIGQEMYTFSDRNESLVSLRPEGTAGCLRSVLSNGLIQKQKQKVYYCGPMFRRERPQQGRFRQFSHFGVEVYGYPTGYIDIELILMSHRMWQTLKLSNIKLHINFLGSPSSRTAYHAVLTDYWLAHKDQLTEDEKIRAEKNPLRLLDSKNPVISDLIHQAPAIQESLSTLEKEQFAQITTMLDAYHIDYIISNRLVRGLDYYSDFIFEWISDDLGAQSTIMGGGRYDPLVKNMGHAIPAIGFAAGIDRIESLLNHRPPRAEKITVAFENKDLYLKVIGRLETIRHPNIVLNIDAVAGKFKNKINFCEQNTSDYLLYCGDASCKLVTIESKAVQKLSFDDFLQWYTQR